MPRSTNNYIHYDTDHAKRPMPQEAEANFPEDTREFSLYKSLDSILEEARVTEILLINVLELFTGEKVQQIAFNQPSPSHIGTIRDIEAYTHRNNCLAEQINELVL